MSHSGSPRGDSNTLKSLCSAAFIPNILSISTASGNSCEPHSLHWNASSAQVGSCPAWDAISCGKAFEVSQWHLQSSLHWSRLFRCRNGENDLSIGIGSGLWAGLDSQMSLCSLHLIVAPIPGPKHEEDAWTYHSNHLVNWCMHFNLGLAGISTCKTISCSLKKIYMVYLLCAGCWARSCGRDKELEATSQAWDWHVSTWGRWPKSPVVVSSFKKSHQS